MPYGKYESHANHGSMLLPFVCRRDTGDIYNKGFLPHWHEQIEILHCLEGTGTVVINGTAYDFKPDSMLIVNPNRLHMLICERYVRYNCIIIFVDFLQENGIDTNEYVFDTVVNSRETRELHKKMCEDFYNKRSPLKIRIDALELMYNLCENFMSQNPYSNECANTEIKSAIEYTQRNYAENITLDKIAKESNLSKFYFAKKFKKITGKTYNEYLTGIRCGKAAESLMAGKSVNEASYLSGFNDTAYFSRVFKKHFGVPPSKYAQKASKK